MKNFIKRHTPALSKREGAGHRGFTLIELLVVVAIIAILSGTILVALNSARSKAKDARVQSELQELESQMELYYSTAGNYVGTASAQVAASPANCTAAPFNVSSAAGTNGPATLIAGIDADSGGGTSYTGMSCGANDSSWAVSATLSTTKTWCVDSNGDATSTAAGFTAGTFQCQ